MNDPGATLALQRLPRTRLWWVGGVLLLLVILIGVSALGALARVDAQRSGIEKFLRERTGLDVRFARLRIQLGFYGPEAVFSDVEFRAPSDGATLLHAQSVTARFEYFRVLRDGALQPGLITLRDADVYLDALGLEPAGTPSQLAAATDAPQAMDLLAQMERRTFHHFELFVAVLPEASLRFESVALHLPRGPQTRDSWVLQSSLIAVDKSQRGLRMAGTLRLPERLGQSVWFRLDAPPDTRSSGTLELRTRGLAVAAWRDLAQIPADLGGALDLHLDARWRRAQWQSAEGELSWQLADQPFAANLHFDRSTGVLSADAPRMPLPLAQQLWRAFDPAAQVMARLDDLQARGDLSQVHWRWTPQAPSGMRTRVTAQWADGQLRSRAQDLLLAPLKGELLADEHQLQLTLSADAAELRRDGAPVGSGRVVAFSAQLHNQGSRHWTIALRSGSLGPRGSDDPDAMDRPLPELAALLGELHWDVSGPWRGALQGQASQQAFDLRWRGDQKAASLDAVSVAHWQARLQLQHAGPQGWRVVAGRISLGAAPDARLRLPRAKEILVSGKIADLDLLALQPVLTHWPEQALMPPWRGSVRVARLGLGGQMLGRARLQLQRSDGSTLLSVDGAALAGALRLVAGDRWDVDLRRAYVAQDERGAALLATLLARKIAATVTVADLRLGQHRLGRLALQLEPADGELQLQRVVLQGAAQLRGSGSCAISSGRCSARLTLRGEHLGAWLRQVGQGAPLGGQRLRGELRLDWPLRSSDTWLGSLDAMGQLSAKQISRTAGTDSAAGWAAALSDIGEPVAFSGLTADVGWRNHVLQWRSFVLRHDSGDLAMTGQLDYGRQSIDQQWVWQPNAEDSALPNALVTLETATRESLPTLAGAVGDVGRWVSGAPPPQRWLVSGRIDAPQVTPVVAE